MKLRPHWIIFCENDIYEIWIPIAEETYRYQCHFQSLEAAKEYSKDHGYILIS